MKHAENDSITTTFNSTNYVGTVEICVTLRVGWDCERSSTHREER
jgi:hypothetical protein